MFSHNFIDTVKHASDKMKQVNASQLVLLVGAFFLLLGALCLLFVSKIIASLDLPMNAFYLMMFALVIVFFDTSNLELMVRSSHPIAHSLSLSLSLIRSFTHSLTSRGCSASVDGLWCLPWLRSLAYC